MMRAGAEWVVSLTTLVTMRVTICRGVTPSGGSKPYGPYVLSPQSPKGSTLGRSISAPQRDTMVVRVQGGEPCEERLFLALMSQSGVDPFAVALFCTNRGTPAQWMQEPHKGHNAQCAPN